MSKCPTQSKVLGYYSLCLITAWLKASESCSGTRGTKELVQSEQMKRISIKDIETHACLLVIHFWPLLESLFQSISFKTTNKWSFPRTWNLHLQSLKWLVSTGVRSQCFVPSVTSWAPMRWFSYHSPLWNYTVLCVRLSLPSWKCLQIWVAVNPYKKKNGMAKRNHNLWDQADLDLNPQPSAY